jgi:SHS2 domain-containing protein
MDTVTTAAGTFREFEHTGDAGIEVEARSRADMFALALVALAHLMVEPAEVRPREERSLSVAAGSDSNTMHDLLSAALSLFLTDGFIWSDAQVRERDGGLAVTLAGETFDATRHTLIQEAKAVTYHDLAAEARGGAWYARIIIDV